MKIKKISILTIIGVAFTFCVLVALAWGFFVEPRLLEVREIELEIVDLPASCDGMRVALISDLHAFDGIPFPQLLEKVVAEVDKKSPDAIFFLGDIVYGEIATRNQNFQNMTAYLSRFHAKFGVYSVLGNHEVWHDRSSVIKATEAANVRHLGNERLTIKCNGAEIDLAGTDDSLRFEDEEQKFLKNLEKRKGVPLLVLAHIPASIADLTSHRDITMFSGHTHGGQIRIFNKSFKEFFSWKYPVDNEGYREGRNPGKKYKPYFDRGFYQYRGNSLYVVSGIGCGRISIRFMCRPELVFVTLRQPGKALNKPVPGQIFEAEKRDD